MNAAILPIMTKKGSFKVAVEAGKKYFYCSCGATQNQPFCDGSHKAFKNEDGTSRMKSIAYEATENKEVYFCGCRQSKNGIFCDGTHNGL